MVYETYTLGVKDNGRGASTIPLGLSFSPSLIVFVFVPGLSSGETERCRRVIEREKRGEGVCVCEREKTDG